MSLPFLKLKDRSPGGVLTEIRPSDNKDEQKDEGLRACSRDIISAVHSHDEAGLEAALRAAFHILDSEPHREGEHTNEQEED